MESPHTGNSILLFNITLTSQISGMFFVLNSGDSDNNDGVLHCGYSG